MIFPRIDVKGERLRHQPYLGIVIEIFDSVTAVGVFEVVEACSRPKMVREAPREIAPESGRAGVEAQRQGLIERGFWGLFGNRCLRCARGQYDAAVDREAGNVEPECF